MCIRDSVNPPNKHKPQSEKGRRPKRKPSRRTFRATALINRTLRGLSLIHILRGVELTGKLQNGFMFFFWGVAAIWFLTMIPNVQLPNFVTAPDFRCV